MSNSALSSTASLARLQELLPQLFQTTQLTGQPYLRLLLTADLGAFIPMEHVQESLLVPAAQITALPNLAEGVIGLMSSREQVFCVVNLPQVFGYDSMAGTQRQYRVVVVRISHSGYQVAAQTETLLGLAVPQIQGVTRLSETQLHSVTELCPALLKPYVTGTSYQNDQVTYILSPQALVQAPALALTSAKVLT